MNKSLKAIVALILLLVVISCSISIMNNDIYQDGDWANAQWLGQDMVTLFIAAPMLLVSYFQAISKKRWKWNMVLSGILFYFVYTYTFFVFVAELTFLYLFHLPIFGLSIFGLFITLYYLFRKDYEIEDSSYWVKRGVTLFLFSISGMLSFLWLSEIISHVTLPDFKSNTPSGEPTLIIYSLDLALVVPLMGIGAIGYIKKKQYGYKLTGVMLTKSATVGFALMAMSVSMFVQNISLDTFLILLWFFIGILGCVLTVIYLRGIKKN